MDSFDLIKKQKGRMVEALTDKREQENARIRPNAYYDAPKMSRAKNLESVKNLSYDEKLKVYKDSTEELLRFYTGMEAAPSAELALFSGYLSALSGYIGYWGEKSAEKLNGSDITELKKLFTECSRTCNEYLASVRKADNAGPDILFEDFNSKVAYLSSLIEQDRKGISIVSTAKQLTLKELFAELRTEPFNTDGAEISEYVAGGQNRRLHIKKGNKDFAFTETKEILTPEKVFGDLPQTIPEGKAMFDALKNDDQAQSLFEATFGPVRACFLAVKEKRATENDMARIRAFLGAFSGRLPRNARNIDGLMSSERFLISMVDLADDYLTAVNNVKSAFLSSIKAGRSFEKRNVAMSRTAELLGLSGIIANSETATIIHEGVKKTGVIMDWVNGTSESTIKNNKNIDTLGNGNLLKQLADLEVLDFICGNVDRHPGNLVYHVENNKLIGITGIDNDSSFGNLKGTVEEKNSNLTQAKDILVMRRRTASRVLSLTKDELKYTLTDLIEPDEIEDAWNRVQVLKAQIEESMMQKPEDGALRSGFSRILSDDDNMWDDLDIAKLSNVSYSGDGHTIYDRLNSNFQRQSSEMGIERVAKIDEYHVGIREGSRLYDIKIPQKGAFTREQINVSQTFSLVMTNYQKDYNSDLYTRMGIRDGADCLYVGGEKLTDYLKKHYGFEYETRNLNKMNILKAYATALTQNGLVSITFVHPQIDKYGRPELVTTDILYRSNDETPAMKESRERLQDEARATRKLRHDAIREVLEEKMWENWRHLTGSKLQSPARIRRLINKKGDFAMNGVLIPTGTDFAKKAYRRENENVRDLDKDQKDLIKAKKKEKVSVRKALIKKQRAYKQKDIPADPLKELASFPMLNITGDRDVVDNYEKLKELQALLLQVDASNDDKLAEKILFMSRIVRYAESRLKIIGSERYTELTDTQLKYLYRKDVDQLTEEDAQLKRDMEECSRIHAEIKENSFNSVSKKVEEHKKEQTRKEKKDAEEISIRRMKREQKEQRRDEAGKRRVLQSQAKDELAATREEKAGEDRILTGDFKRREFTDEEAKSVFNLLENLNLERLRLKFPDEIMAYAPANRRVLAGWRHLRDAYDYCLASDKDISLNKIKKIETKLRMLDQAQRFIELTLSVCSSDYYVSGAQGQAGDPEWDAYVRMRDELQAHPMYVGVDLSRLKTDATVATDLEFQNRLNKLRRVYDLGHMKPINDVEKNVAIAWLEDHDMINEFLNDPANSKTVNGWIRDNIPMERQKEFVLQEYSNRLNLNNLARDPRLFIPTGEGEFDDTENRLIEAKRRDARGKLVKEAFRAEEAAERKATEIINGAKENGEYAQLGELVKKVSEFDVDDLRYGFVRQSGRVLPVLKRLSVLKTESDFINLHAVEAGISAEVLARFNTLIYLAEETDRLYRTEKNAYAEGLCDISPEDIKDQGFYQRLNKYSDYIRKGPEGEYLPEAMGIFKNLIGRYAEVKALNNIGDDYGVFFQNCRIKAEDDIVENDMKNAGVLRELNGNDYGEEALRVHKDKRVAFLENSISQLKVFMKDEEKRSTKNSQRYKLLNARLKQLGKMRDRVRSMTYPEAIAEQAELKDERLGTDLKTIAIPSSLFIISSADVLIDSTPDFESGRVKAVEFYTRLIESYDRMIGSLPEGDEAIESRNKIQQLKEKRQAEKTMIETVPMDSIMIRKSVRYIANWKDVTENVQANEKQESIRLENLNKITDQYIKDLEDDPLDPGMTAEQKNQEKLTYDDERSTGYKPNTAKAELEGEIRQLFTLSEDDLKLRLQENNGDWGLTLGKQKSGETVAKELCENLFDDLTARDVRMIKMVSSLAAGTGMRDMRLGGDDEDIVVSYMDNLMQNPEFAASMGVHTDAQKERLKGFFEESQRLIPMLAMKNNFTSLFSGSLALNGTDNTPFKKNLARRIKKDIDGISQKISEDLGHQYVRKLMDLIDRFFRFVDSEGIKVEFTKVDGEKAEYDTRLDAFEKLADLGNVKEIKVNGKTMSTNNGLDIPAEIRLKDNVTEEAFAELLRKHNELVSKRDILSNLSRDNTLPDTKNMNEADKNTVKKVSGASEPSLCGFRSEMRIRIYYDTIKQLEEQIKGSLLLY